MGRLGSNTLLNWLAPVSLGVFLVAAWFIITRGESNGTTFFFPTPGAFVNRLTELIQEAWFWKRVSATLGEAVLGSILGAVVAIPTSWLIYRSRFVSAALQPFLGATQAIPAVALAPLLVLWIGRGIGPVTFLCALMVFFPILVSTTVGLRHLDRDLLNAAALDGASGWRLIWSIELPLVSPSLLAGVRNGFTLSITGAVVGEMVMGGAGLGQLISQQQHNLDIAGMFVTVFVLCLLAMSFYSLVYLAELRGRTMIDGFEKAPSSSASKGKKQYVP